MGPDSKDAITRLLGHLIDEMQQQRATGKETLREIRELARRVENQEQDHEALAEKVAKLPRYANGHGSE
jgi:hypothetical protein